MTKEKEQSQEALAVKLEAIEKQLYDGVKATIKEVKEMTNHEFFESESFEKRKGIAVYADLDNGEEISEWYNIEIDPRGYKQSNIYLFKKEYGDIPTEGLHVRMILNDDGFFRIKK
jgi:hypothetical protein